VAIGADALQLAVTPLFVEGALSPADAVLDAVVFHGNINNVVISGGAVFRF
jgi:hypothetical protein